MATTEKKATTAREALLMAAELLSKRGAWIKKVFAMNRQGQPVYARSVSAVCFCADGALLHVTSNERIYGAAYTRLVKVDRR